MVPDVTALAVTRDAMLVQAVALLTHPAAAKVLAAVDVD